MKRYIKLNRLAFIVFSTLSFSATVQASGFAIIEDSVSGLGNAYAGGSAVAEDATTVFYNPAGMSRLQKNQLVVAGHYIQPEIKFKNDGSSIAGAATVQTSGGNGGDAGKDVLVPNFYYMNNINAHIDFGLGINAPFGLETNYLPDWVGRYHALKSELVTVNINPALSFKITEKFSMGFGINYSMVDVTLTSAIDQPTVCAGLVGSGFADYAGCAGLPESNDGYADISGDSTAWGVNMGILYQFSDRQRLGFAYRSNIRHDVSGTADFSNIDSILADTGNSRKGLFNDSPATAQLNLPAIWSLSYFHSLNAQWDIMADYTFTQWSTMRELRIDYAQNNNQGSTIEELDWKDTNRYSVGANFHPSKEMTIRVGYAFDESPVTSSTKATARVPDADRTWLTVGLGYAASKTISLDVGYAMIAVADSNIDRTNGTKSTLKGSYDSEINILSAQLNWDF